jgi:hypothetical protein
VGVIALTTLDATTKQQQNNNNNNSNICNTEIKFEMSFHEALSHG